jgi:hypothetical protein
MVDFLFWKKTPGISLLLWISILLIGGIYLAISEKKRIAPWSWVLVAAVLLPAGITFWREEPLTQAVNFLYAIGLVLILAMVLLSGYWLRFRVVDYLKSGIQLVAATVARPIELFARSNGKEPDANAADGFKNGFLRALPVFRGLLIAIPIIAVLAALLSSADLIFSERLQDFFSFFDIQKLGEYVFRLIYILVLAYIFAGVYLFAIHPKKESQASDFQTAWLKPFLGWTEAVVILVCVDLLFALFVFVQFQYFFGGQANISLSGYTYSEYARRGFNELLLVALISLLLYLGLGSITRLKQRYEKLVFSILSGFMIVLVIVILASAFQRLLLYEDAYGFTRFRTYPHVFMAWLAVLLGFLLVLEIIQKRRYAVPGILAVGLGFSLSLGFVNVDALVVRQNVQRAEAGEELDSQYLSQLSSDAVPVMAGLFQQPDLPKSIRDILGMELACRTQQAKENPVTAWQSFHLSRHKAGLTLSSMSEQLAAYPVRVENDVWMVSAGGDTYQCPGTIQISMD